jgi:hypothetical protein
MRKVIAAGALLFLTSCGSVTMRATPAGPTPTTPPTPPTPFPDPREGNYQLTFAADSSCTSLPSTVRTRAYSTSLWFSPRPDGTISLYFTPLAGAVFAPSGPTYPRNPPSWNSVGGVLRSGFVQLFFDDPPIWEYVTPDTSLEIAGEAHGTLGETTTDLELSGVFTYCEAMKPRTGDWLECSVPPFECRSRSHKLTLMRQ